MAACSCLTTAQYRGPEPSPSDVDICHALDYVSCEEILLYQYLLIRSEHLDSVLIPTGYLFHRAANWLFYGLMDIIC